MTFHDVAAGGLQVCATPPSRTLKSEPPGRWCQDMFGAVTWEWDEWPHQRGAEWFPAPRAVGGRHMGTPREGARQVCGQEEDCHPLGRPQAWDLQLPELWATRLHHSVATSVCCLVTAAQGPDTAGLCPPEKA